MLEFVWPSPVHRSYDVGKRGIGEGQYLPPIGIAVDDQDKASVIDTAAHRML